MSADRPAAEGREPWRRFESQVDPAAELSDEERQRRAKIAYRAHMRSLARSSVKARAAAKRRRDAAQLRSASRPPTERALAAFRHERDEWMAAFIIIAAAQRGQPGIEALRRHQRRARADCALCRRPFPGAELVDP